MKKLSKLFIVALCALVAVNAWAADADTDNENTQATELTDAYDALVASINEGTNQQQTLTDAETFSALAHKRLAEMKEKLGPDLYNKLQGQLGGFDFRIDRVKNNQGNFSDTNLAYVGGLLKTFRSDGARLFLQRAARQNPGAANDAQDLLNTINTGNPNTQLLNATAAVTSPTI